MNLEEDVEIFCNYKATNLINGKMYIGSAANIMPT